MALAHLELGPQWASGIYSIRMNDRLFKQYKKQVKNINYGFIHT